ncbi:MAG: hypothetical protein L0G16_03830 [Weeksellaceae bacterium]|nr:hypothetical protein [Weeksellaceae bacterium]
MGSLSVLHSRYPKNSPANPQLIFGMSSIQAGLHNSMLKKQPVVDYLITFVKN